MSGVTIEVGEAAPGLSDSYPDANDEQHVVADALARGPVLIGMYKSSCQASKAMFPFLQRLADRYGDRGLSVFGVAQDSANITRSFARRLDLSFPILVEGPDYPLSRAFDIAATPSVFLIRPDGTIAWETMGFLKPQIDDMAAAVAEAVGAQPEPCVTDADADVPMFVPG